jgi:glutathione S-transferase
MLTLYHAPRSRSFRMLWLLEELAVPYELKLVEIRRGDGSGSEPGAEYRKIHPHAKVPALMHDGASVFETPAIALYLTDTFVDKGLGPKIGDKLRGPYLSWLAYSTGVIEPAILEKVLKIPHQVGTFGWASPDEVEAMLESALSSNPYLLGPKFSAADVVVGGTMLFMLQFKLLTPKAMFTAYTERLAARPAYKRAQEKDSGATP